MADPLVQVIVVHYELPPVQLAPYKQVKQDRNGMYQAARRSDLRRHGLYCDASLKFEPNGCLVSARWLTDSSGPAPSLLNTSHAPKWSVKGSGASYRLTVLSHSLHVGLRTVGSSGLDTAAAIYD